jgi:starch synthase
MAKKKKQNLSILMVTTEMVPFAKSGGMADAVSALAQELDRIGHDVRVLMPRYYGIRRERLYRYPTPFTIRVGQDQFTTAVYEGRLGDSSVVVYFIDHEDLYARQGIYGEGNQPYPDNLRRFSVLSQASLQIGSFLGWEPQVVQSHDWPTALVPLLSRRLTPRSARRPATVLTIHNIGYQGGFYVSDYPSTGLGWELLTDSGLLHHNEINVLKSGIVNADMVSTVSPQYAKEIQTPRKGFLLDRELAARGDTLTGILNGVDYTVWNPERDPFLDVKYTAETIALKSRLKTQLQHRLDLPERSDIPLIGMVSRLTDQKGWDEMVAPGYGALPQLMESNSVQFAILGSGDERYEYYLRAIAHRYPGLGVEIGFDEELAHLIEGASDFFLMPSRYEPCGLNQLYSLRYGTLPIVTTTGGFVDTVEPFGPKGGTGFLIEEPSPPAIVETVNQAISMWSNEHTRIEAMQRAAMKLRFSWEDAGASYVSVFEQAIELAAETP